MTEDDNDDIEEPYNEIFDCPNGEQLFPTIYKALEQHENHLSKKQPAEILLLLDSDDFLKDSEGGGGHDQPVIIDFTTSTLGVKEADCFLQKCFHICEHLPSVQSDTNFHKLSTLFIDLDFQGEFVWTTDFRIDLILEAHWEGFLIIAYQCKFKFKQHQCFFEILLPRLHLKRACVRLDDKKLKPTPKSVRRRCRKLANLQFTIDKDLVGVLEGISKQHKCSWVNSLMKRLWQHWHSLEPRLIEMNLPTLHSIEIWDGNTLVAGEVGVSIGSIYTSLTGFHSVNGTGSIQLWALTNLLRSCGYAVWDLGMYMEYKTDLNAVALNRKDFVTLFRTKREVQPQVCLKEWRDKSPTGVLVSSLVP